MIFAQMLEIVALSDLVSVMCARKFSFDPQGDLPAAERPQHCVLVYYYFYSYEFGRRRFLCFFFYLAVTERPQLSGCFLAIIMVLHGKRKF